MQSLPTRIVFAAIWVVVVIVITLPSVYSLPYFPYSTSILVTGTGLVGFRLSESILDKVTGKETKSVVLLKHYEELKAEVFAKLRDSKVVLTLGTHSEKGHYYSSPVPLLLTIDRDSSIDPILRSMAFDHLQSFDISFG